jgi:hypothetical protein
MRGRVLRTAKGKKQKALRTYHPIEAAVNAMDTQRSRAGFSDRNF